MKKDDNERIVDESKVEIAWEGAQCNGISITKDVATGTLGFAQNGKQLITHQSDLWKNQKGYMFGLFMMKNEDVKITAV